MANVDGPEWLKKLEMRREKIKGKLAHEIGRGARCNKCKDCPGLDLHFWRKICLKCKCKKEQHEIQNDDVTGWGQFEILGAIRSKPAYVKISKLSENPIKVDFIPANVPEDVASEYLEKLGLNNIPMHGSEAAKIRKQQLEYQVPPHDLDPSLCHNLTENEAEQLNLYVDKIRKNCLGQASVVRVETTPIKTYKNPILNQNDYQDPLKPDFMESNALSDKNKYKLKLMQINAEVIKAVIQHYDIIDEIFKKIKANKMSYENDNILGPIDKFRKEYISNPTFQEEVLKYLVSIEDDSKPSSSDIILSKVKAKSQSMSKHNMIYLKQTPIDFSKKELQTKANIQDFFDSEGNPLIPTIYNDKLLTCIINSNIVKGILHNTSQIIAGTRMQISGAENLKPDFHEFPLAVKYLDETTKQFLCRTLIDSHTVQSATVNGIVYDKLFQDLDDHKVQYSDDKVLGPAKKFREEFTSKEPFRQQIYKFVQGLGDFFLDNDEESPPLPPPIPNYSTYPGNYNTNDLPAPPSPLLMQTHDVRFPVIQELVKMSEQHSVNNNPTIRLSEDLEKIQIDASTRSQICSLVGVVECIECKLDIMAGEIAVKAERAGASAAWHPSCFVCKHCKELLADLVYFYHNKNVYCARDLALLLKIPRCAACDELIFTKEYTKAEEGTYHFQHFCCFICDLPLAGEKYVHDEKSNQPVCIQCYEMHFSNKCGVCQKVIAPTEQGVSFKSTHYHAVTCFKCQFLGCRKSLLGSRFCVKESMPFCSSKCLNAVFSTAL